MARLPIALLLALLLNLAPISSISNALEMCAATCSDDGSDGGCGPTCFDCACCHHAANPIAANPGIVLLKALSLHDATPAKGRVPASDPEDVFHVPRLDLA